MLTRIRYREHAGILKDTYRRWRDVRPELLSGGLAFFAILSAAPLLVVLIALLQNVIAKAGVTSQLDAVLSPRVGGLVREWLVPPEGSGGTTLTMFSAVVLLFSASQVFIQLRVSLDFIWNVQVKSRPSWAGFFKSIMAPLIMILGGGIFVLAFVLLDAGIGIAGPLLGSVVPGLESPVLWKLASAICSLMIFTFFFGGIFKLVPSHALRWRDVLMGAVLTSGLFALGKLLLSLYFSWISFDSFYGMAGSLIVIMIWIYTSAQIFFFGAVFTYVTSKAK